MAYMKNIQDRFMYVIQGFAIFQHKFEISNVPAVPLFFLFSEQQVLITVFIDTVNAYSIQV